MKTIRLTILLSWLSLLSIQAKPVGVGFTGVMELKHGFIILECAVNGIPGNYILDSGAPGLIINKTDNLLAIHAQPLLGVNDSIRADYVFVDSFEWQGLIHRNVPALEMDVTLLEKALGIPIAGLIGFNLFKGYYVNINFQDNIIALTSRKQEIKDQSSFELKMTQNGHLNVVTISSHGVQLKLALDTGSNRNLIDLGTARRHFTNAKHMGTIHLLGVNMEPTLRTKIAIEDFQVGKTKETAIFVATDISPTNEQLDYPIDGILGQEFLNNYNLLIDKKQRSVRFYKMNEKSIAYSDDK